ncbi:STAS domain-containing protein [Alteromonas sp. ASW11-130]|uniref:STAS domain-containing protein n=1 Tax=Alteromonas sp. ASW11-130 TaxID=3015775 RepID=UPI0022429A42|nr:STAS domain-containing protein [Alteromonas sp. ASW11-130]MCW8092992.1 STAS domain-containing protein [Alteromonas sp. ASW11-130]
MPTIRLPSKFDFSQHKTFTEQYENVLAEDSKVPIQLDFSAVEYLDSAALGMMVLLRKKAVVKNREVQMKNVRGTAYELLSMANFQKLFKIN